MLFAAGARPRGGDEPWKLLEREFGPSQRLLDHDAADVEPAQALREIGIESPELVGAEAWHRQPRIEPQHGTDGRLAREPVQNARLADQEKVPARAAQKHDERVHFIRLV